MPKVLSVKSFQIFYDKSLRVEKIYLSAGQSNRNFGGIKVNGIT